MRVHALQADTAAAHHKAALQSAEELLEAVRAGAAEARAQLQASQALAVVRMGRITSAHGRPTIS